MTSGTVEGRLHDELPRVLTATHALAIVVGIIIGSGIFLVPREMMAAVGSSRMVYAVWIIGGLLSLFGAMSYAEVAAMRPRVGGEYAFLYDAYGPLTAFLYTWTWTMVAKPASIATIAAGLMRVLGTFPAFGFLDRTVFAHLVQGSGLFHGSGLLWGQVMAIAATWLITGLNIVSTRDSAQVQTMLTWLKVLMIVVIAGFCFASVKYGDWHNFGTKFTGARGRFAGFMIALIAALWAYDGWSDVSQMAGEVKQPQRSLPVALIGGVTIVGALYMLTNAAIQYVLPSAAIAATDRPATDALQLVAGNLGAGLVAVGMAVSICATFVGSSLSGARVPFAAAHDRLFPSVLGKIHPRFKTPWASLVLQAVLSTLLLLAIGRFQALFSLAIFAEWLFYALTAATVFVFRVREPDAYRPYRVTGYPVVPALFILAALVLLVFSFMNQPRESIAGAIVILCGVPLHFLFQRIQSPDDRAI
jgi:APA family basic amino acid/polyamine antiporter